MSVSNINLIKEVDSAVADTNAGITERVDLVTEDEYDVSVLLPLRALTLKE